MTERRAKYNARRVTLDGYTFDSAAEANRYAELKLAGRAGEISGLRVHPRYRLQEGFNTADGERVRPIYYIADFEYIEDGIIVAEDVKGVKTAVFKLKEKLFKYRYPEIDFRLVKCAR